MPSLRETPRYSHCGHSIVACVCVCFAVFPNANPASPYEGNSSLLKVNWVVIHHWKIGINGRFEFSTVLPVYTQVLCEIISIISQSFQHKSKNITVCNITIRLKKATKPKTCFRFSNSDICW